VAIEARKRVRTHCRARGTIINITRAITGAALAAVAVASGFAVAASPAASTVHQPRAIAARAGTSADDSPGGVRVNLADFTHPADDNIIYAPATLNPGDQWTSPDGQTGLEFTSDGYLEVWQGNQGNTVWQASSNPGARATFQNDGNLVIYDSNGNPVWAAQGSSVPFCTTTATCTLHVQDDGNVTLRNQLNLPYWASNTNHS
jgi:hypothetical protein